MRTDNASHYKTEMFTGYDTDQSMLRIGAMNMMLHGVDEPKISYLDSLSAKNEERNKYTLIMANPPFTGSVFENSISPDLTALCKTKKTELLFLTLFTKMLTTGGDAPLLFPTVFFLEAQKRIRQFAKNLSKTKN